MLSSRRKRYKILRKQRRDLFRNDPGFPYEILHKWSKRRKAESSEKRRLTSERLPRTWRHTGVVHENPYMIVVRDAVRFPDGQLGTYIRTMPFKAATGAAILPIFKGKIVLLCHARHATRRVHLEIPRGFGELGVTPQGQGLKELSEEIGAESHTAISLGKFYSNTGLATDCTELFLTKINSIGEPQVSEGILGIETYCPSKVASLIRDGKIADSFTIAAFTRAWLLGHFPDFPSPLQVDGIL